MLDTQFFLYFVKSIVNFGENNGGTKTTFLKGCKVHHEYIFSIFVYDVFINFFLGGTENMNVLAQ